MSLPEQKKKIQRSESPFTLRLKQEFIKKLNLLSIEMGVSKSKIVKSYIHLSNYFLVEPNLNLTTFTKMDLSVFPKEILKGLLHKLSETEQISIGDNLGTIINNNSQIIGLQSFKEKRELIQGLNWIKFTPVTLYEEEKNTETDKVEKIKKEFWGISKDMWPISIIHAMLFRIMYNQRFKDHWETSIFIKYLELTPKKRRDFRKNPKLNKVFTKVKDFVLKFDGEIGSKMENFDEEYKYHIFDILRIEDE